MWFLLVDQDGAAYKGTTASSVSIPSNYVIDQFRDAAKAMYPKVLSQTDAGQLLVFRNKTAFNAKTVDARTNFRSSHSLEEANEEIGLGPDEDHALLVVVPDQDDMDPSYFVEPNIQDNVKNSIFRIFWIQEMPTRPLNVFFFVAILL